MSDKEDKKSVAITAAQQTACGAMQWFFSAICPTLAEHFEPHQFSALHQTATPLFRGEVLTVKPITGFHHDLTSIPSVISGFKGLRAVKRNNHPAPSCPNTVYFLQLCQADPLLNKQERYALMYYHPDSMAILDFTITVHDGMEEDCVDIETRIFSPKVDDKYKNVKRYIFHRRGEIEAIARQYALSALDVLNAVDKDPKGSARQFYARLANELGIRPVVPVVNGVKKQDGKD